MKLSDFKAIGVRRFYEMEPGSIFRATIQDIQPGKVIIRLGDGELYTARSMVLPPAHIGEDCLFGVKENDFRGKIILEVVKSGTKFSFDMRV
ncbi:MAG: hypothetical protein FWF77_03115 [Defluviitaleaceae bacterium]|nr:hypothetical protein [Defluviitaleaceae bacterium]